MALGPGAKSADAASTEDANGTPGEGVPEGGTGGPGQPDSGGFPPPPDEATRLGESDL